MYVPAPRIIRVNDIWIVLCEEFKCIHNIQRQSFRYQSRHAVSGFTGSFILSGRLVHCPRQPEAQTVIYTTGNKPSSS